MLILIATFRKSRGFPTFSLIANYGLILAGGLLFLMQMHGYQHTANPEEFTSSSETAQGVEEENQRSTKIAPEGSEQSEWKDSITISIPAGAGKEYKFHVLKGESLEYSWKTTNGALFYDFHGEPTGGPQELSRVSKRILKVNRGGHSLLPSMDLTGGTGPTKAGTILR